ncbi:MAG TPA: DUF305 domain-containing protein [Xanthobacteraceae bacterium]|nr:DUF305 domain-containing protein [Xanthobacteraceae bacterium]
MRFPARFATAAAALALAAGVALAQSGTMPMPGMDHSGMSHGTAPAAGPSTKAYVAANEKMHRDMAIRFTGDADADFARGMIPHHQGAIDMARIELQYGTDPELRKLAEGIIKAQESEIAFLKAWLAKSGK